MGPDKPRVIEPTGETFRVIADVETIDDNDGAAVDEDGCARVVDVLTDQEVKDRTWERKGESDEA